MGRRRKFCIDIVRRRPKSARLLLLVPAPLLPRCSRLEISAACARGLARSLLEPLG